MPRSYKDLSPEEKAIIDSKTSAVAALVKARADVTRQRDRSASAATQLDAQLVDIDSQLNDLQSQIQEGDTSPLPDSKLPQQAHRGGRPGSVAPTPPVETRKVPGEPRNEMVERQEPKPEPMPPATPPAVQPNTTIRQPNQG